MAKQVTAQGKLQCPGGSATPAPPVGPALGAHGVNIGMFVKQFNDKTNKPEMKGLMLPVAVWAKTAKDSVAIARTSLERSLRGTLYG